LGPGARQPPVGDRTRGRALWAPGWPRGREPLPGKLTLVNRMAWSADGSTIAAGTRDGTLRAWDAKTQLPRPPLGKHRGGILALTLSADGRLLGAAGGRPVNSHGHVGRVPSEGTATAT